MKRDVYQSLEAWKTSSRRKPLIINGARQVGKTYALKHFGKTSYQNVVYLNFEKNEALCKYFDDTLDPKKLITILSIHSDIDIKPKSTLILFDEVQECPKALNSLKYFCEEASEFHIAAAGSLLGVKTANQKGFPVGKVNFLHMYPLTFFEFLSAIKQEKLRTYLEELNSFNPIAEILHEKLLSFLKLYFYIGGMPEVVNEYVKSNNLNNIREIQLEIINAYEKDFAKHAPISEIMKITSVYKYIHTQLAKKNKKFIFSAIKKSARGRDYEDAIQWLLDAGLIYKSFIIKSPKFPLSAYSDNNIFKIFLSDIGLLAAQSNLSKKAILEKDALFTEFKGALTENFIAQELAAKNKNLFYWASAGSAEIDFLIEKDHGIYPLEVKSGNNKKKKSLFVYDKKYLPSKLIKASNMNLKLDGKIYNYPLYLISKIPIDTD
jgi:hypothetical protein